MTEAKGFSAITALPAYRLVSDAIEKQIVGGHLSPGDVLPPETALAGQFNVNRSTVREGIRLLEESGLLERRGGKRLYVTLPQMFEVASRASRALMLHAVTYQELWEASMAVEPAVAALAAGRIQDTELDRLERNLAEMEAHRKNLKRFIALDIEFHNLVAQAARNRALTLAREPIGLLLLPASRAVLPKLGTQQRVIDAHRAILDSLKSADAEVAGNWMRKHMADFKRGYELAGYSPEKRLVQPEAAAADR